METENRDFISQLYMKGRQKAKEYIELSHEQQRLEMHIERTKQYVEQLNNFLKAEGFIEPLIKEDSSEN